MINLYDFPDEASRVELGGVDLDPLHLVELNGCKIEDDWQVQKGTDASGATAVWRGTKLVDDLQLTLEGPDRDSFAMFQTLWDLMKPQPGGTGGGASSTTQLPASVNAALGGSGTGAGLSSSSSSTTAKTPSAPSGPKPPTLRIKNALINHIGVDRVARKSWEWKAAKGASWRVIATFIQIKPSTPAKTGAADSAKDATNDPANPPDKQVQEIQDLLKKASSL
jgi:hypothetical protein